MLTKRIAITFDINSQFHYVQAAAHGVSSFLTRRHSTGDGNSHSNVVLPPYPPSTPDHMCREFTAPEGTYTQGHSIFMTTMQPLYSVGTTASLVSIKYKEAVSNNLQRYEPQPGARSFRRMFGHTPPSNSTTDSDEEHITFGTPSLSSSSSSHKNINVTNGTPLSHCIPEEPAQKTAIIPTSTTTANANHTNESSGSSSPTPTSTLSFLARSSTLGRHSRKPKTNITKTNSSFVQRIITNDQLAKILMARTSEDTNLFYNCGTSFVWVDAAGHPKVKRLK